MVIVCSVNTMKRCGTKIWRLWAKALGEKASTNDNEADKIAIIRSIIVLIYIVTNFVIMAGVLRHWND
jgi:hypothetical protein